MRCALCSTNNAFNSSLHSPKTNTLFFNAAYKWLLSAQMRKFIWGLHFPNSDKNNILFRIVLNHYGRKNTKLKAMYAIHGVRKNLLVKWEMKKNRFNVVINVKRSCFYSSIPLHNKVRNSARCSFLVCRTDYLHILIIVKLCILITWSKSAARETILKIYLEYQRNYERFRAINCIRYGKSLIIMNDAIIQKIQMMQ